VYLLTFQNLASWFAVPIQLLGPGFGRYYFFSEARYWSWGGGVPETFFEQTDSENC